MSLLLFPDNTVLVNFAYLHRMDLLERLARNPAWCGTVAAECARSSGQPDLEDMSEAARIFGEPLRPESPVEHLMVRAYKTRLSRPGDGPYKNLGEAETLAIIECRSLRAIFVTDDNGPGLLLARQGGRTSPITVVTTWELLRVAAKAGYADRDTLWSYVHILRGKARHQPPGDAARDRNAFDRWLDQ
ncbi:MAG TPA: hypothetical protein VFV41_04120 [Streptosporangiaceae bacterium]|nr:hypothetical protein [Streptosporangiaceae bacterium]